jgi:hypothetical protein
MKRCAFLTTDDLTGFVTDDELAVAPLHDLGWSVEHVPWRATVDWDAYDVVVVRSTWDYQAWPAEFDAALDRIDRSRALLCNPLPLMRWNMRKTYLRELQQRGVPTLPTVWDRSPTVRRLRALFAELDTAEIVIKPVIGANADHAWRLRADVDEAVLGEVAGVYCDREFLAQPFLNDVVTEGEYSLIYFTGELSHTILKTPKAGDFRVQEEHGGLITPAQPPTTLLAAAATALAALADVPLYARADFVRTGGDNFAIMELELIEPALYFRMDADSPGRFARAVDRMHRGRRPDTLSARTGDPTRS